MIISANYIQFRASAGKPTSIKVCTEREVRILNNWLINDRAEIVKELEGYAPMTHLLMTKQRTFYHVQIIEAPKPEPEPTEGDSNGT